MYKQPEKFTSVNQNLTFGVFDCRDCAHDINHSIQITNECRRLFSLHFCSVNVEKRCYGGRDPVKSKPFLVYKNC